jgi:hypothetical protein
VFTIDLFSLSISGVMFHSFIFVFCSVSLYGCLLFVRPGSLTREQILLNQSECHVLIKIKLQARVT